MLGLICIVKMCK